ncbi:hypothetical protein [Elizabethkingia ursingii]|uniref:Uncharacterized protein n=1 Tax=Elizabethkingia ursingii TaxID=1756150 RepID=A0AAJ3TNB9_9FLAO|nr:hypothetical protein [Elizabethkingia ursingii]AQX09347.1 hypothetical protein BBD34_12125 [Elizabethkingia ursingii]OPB74286.1 hypothetical protein BAY32_08065 [Elizabethkingia ursingii]
MIKYNPTPNEYSPNLPERLSREDYSKFNKSLSFYPTPISPLKTVWKNETGVFIFLIIGCIFWPVLPIVIIAILINGGLSSITNCYKSAQLQNKLMRRYYDLIYHTNSYEEYSQLFDKELSHYSKRSFYNI